MSNAVKKKAPREPVTLDEIPESVLADLKKIRTDFKRYGYIPTQQEGAYLLDLADALVRQNMALIAERRKP